MKKFISYFLYAVGLLFLIYFGLHYQEELRVTAGRVFDLLPLLMFTAAYAIVFGAYLALPGLVTVVRTPGKVNFDWNRFLIVGVPALLVGVSGILSYNLKLPVLTSPVQWIYLKFGLMGTVLAGVACGYTLLSSLGKAQMMVGAGGSSESEPAGGAETDGEKDGGGRKGLIGKYPIGKIITLSLGAVVVLYSLLNGIIHPVKLVSVRAEVAEDQSAVTVGAGAAAPKQININYVFTFKNLPYSKVSSEALNEGRIRVQPKGNLQRLIEGEEFKEKAGSGHGQIGDVTELNISYRLGTLDTQGDLLVVDPISPELLEEIKDFLYEAELIFEAGGKTTVYDLMDYKEKQ